MRENIGLYRGKRKDNGEWVEGAFLHLNVGRDFICDGTVWIGTLQPVKYEVYPDTVCQHTGLTDKNGRKIFEGDILEFEDVGETGYEYKEGFDFTNRAAVVWEHGRWCMDKFLETNSGVLDDMNGHFHDDFILVFGAGKVIGNIHDDKELLEEKGKTNEL